MKWGKDHLAYWRARIFRQSRSPYYFVQLQCRGERHAVSLEASDADAAAARARTLYEQVRANGWAATLANRTQTPECRGVNYERRHKRLVLLKEELDHRPNGDRLHKRFWEIIRGIGCMNCGFNKWPAILEIHHIDKNRGNDSLDNLCVLCPNCHKAHHRKVAKIGIMSIAQLMKQHGVEYVGAVDQMPELTGSVSRSDRNWYEPDRA
jgi:hypothetical protein